MDRRQLLKQSALAAAAFAFSRDTFSRDIQRIITTNGWDGSTIIKLSSNENPHGPSPAAKAAMMAAVAGSNRYQWEGTTQLREKIAAQFGLTKEHVVIGAGSSELLGFTSLWAALQKGSAIAPDPIFRLWMPAAKKVGLPVKLVPLTSSKVIDLQRMKDAIDSTTKMIYICNPANPTGTVLPAAQLEAFIQNMSPKYIILLDEAYTEFSEEPSMAKMVNEFPNLVVAKTFSKIHGMAGARVGFVLAHPDTVKQINDLQPWANASASAVSVAGALASLDDINFTSFCKTENQKARSIFYKALDKSGMPYINSHTSFVYFDSGPSGKDIQKLLESQQIIGARTFEDKSKWLRLSVGTVAEMQKVADVLTANKT